MIQSEIDYSNKKDKWTVMKYVASFDLLLQYVELIKKIGFQVDDSSIDAINKEMQQTGVYTPRNKPSRHTQYFKIIQICNNMFAYRGKNSNIILTPLCHLLLEHKGDIEKRGKIVATMLANLPYNHPYNKMDDSFNIFPYRLIFKLLLDSRLGGKLYLDDVFYLAAWTKEIDHASYEKLVHKILELRMVSYDDRLKTYSEWLPIQDALANMLHETRYLFEQLDGAGVVTFTEGLTIGTLCHGGFGRGVIPNVKSDDIEYEPTGRRKFSTGHITIKPYMCEYMKRLLDICDYQEKPHSIYQELGTDDYILKLWNFYPNILLEELGINQKQQTRIAFMSDLTQNIKRYSANTEKGDCYRFEDVLCDAFNEFNDVKAETIAKAGTADIECIYLTINEKFDVEAKSTANKLSLINAGRLASHRNKIGSKYTIVVAPNYVPSVIYDIKNTDNVILTVTSLCNYLYQSSLERDDISYKPIFDIIQKNKGCDISRKLDDYVAVNFGIGQKQYDHQEIPSMMAAESPNHTYGA